MTSLPAIPLANSVQEVLDNVSNIIDWSCDQRSRIGYFASLYQDVTQAIEKGINTPGEFEHPDLVTTLDYTFANRYFSALNAYFHPDGDAPPLTTSWRVALDGTKERRPTIAQHLLCAVNAHIDLDLGIATEEAVPVEQLARFESDFNKVNQILNQKAVETINELDKLSPVLRWIDDIMGKLEQAIIDAGLRVTREGAWDFATALSDADSDKWAGMISDRDMTLAPIGNFIINPSTFIAWPFRIIKWFEVKDVRKIIETLSSGKEIGS